MMRAHHRVRMLKLLPQDLSAILTSSSEDDSDSDDEVARQKRIKKKEAKQATKVDLSHISEE